MGGAVRDRDPFSPAQVFAGRGPSTCGKTRERAAVKDLAAGRTGAGTKIDYMIRRPEHVVVVFDDHQRVALVAEPAQDRDQRADLVRMEAGGGLVEHVKRVDQAGAERLGQMTRCSSPAERLRAGRSSVK